MTPSIAAPSPSRRSPDADCGVIDADDIWTRTDYDAVGNVTDLSTARLADPVACASGAPPEDCQTTSYGYDDADRLLCETYADETARCFEYDRAGNLVQRTDQLEQVTDYVYDDLYRLILRDYQDPTEPDDDFTYDIGGRMLSATRDTWVVSFDGYDAVNRLLQTTQDSMVVQYGYDSVAGIRTITYPGGRICTEQMDLRERLEDVTCDSFNAQYAYDLGNRVETRDYNNGMTATYGYNANNWITSLVHSNGGTVADFGYDYDKEGNKRFEEKLHDSGNSEAYEYDDIYRLIDYKVGNLVGATVPIPITQAQYDLDKVGNWDQFTIDADGAGPGLPIDYNNTPNQMNEYDDWSTNDPGEIPDDDGQPDDFADPLPTPPKTGENWAHDKNGNRREDGKRLYEYDDENRLIRITRKVDNVVDEYQYDALGRRVVKTVDVLVTAVVTRFAYDDARVIEEQDNVGVAEATYVYGTYIDEVLNMQRDVFAPPGPEDYYFHQQALWSVAAVTDAVASVVERYAYTDYGCVTITDGASAPVPPNPWGTAHSAIGNPYMFTGRRWDEESGIYYYRARYYDCDSGRFLQRDPLGYMDGMNLYEYVKSDPTNRTDSLGLCSRRELASLDSSSAFRTGGEIARLANGTTICNLSGTKPHMTNSNNTCTRPCTEKHEKKHYDDLDSDTHASGKCCKKARKAYSAAGTPKDKKDAVSKWNAWFNNAVNTALDECPAYTISVSCGEQLEKDKKCANCPSKEPSGTKKEKEKWRKWRECCDAIASYLSSTKSNKKKYCDAAKGKSYTRCPF